MPWRGGGEKGGELKKEKSAGFDKGKETVLRKKGGREEEELKRKDLAIFAEGKGGKRSSFRREVKKGRRERRKRRERGRCLAPPTNEKGRKKARLQCLGMERKERAERGKGLHPYQRQGGKRRTLFSLEGGERNPPARREGQAITS